MSAEGLRAALGGLDDYWRERDPAWARALRPGLSLAEIAQAEKQLRPMLLTEEHRVLYEWHDGDGDKAAFGAGWPEFIPLATAIEWWRFGKDELGWTPCWLPLLNAGQDYRVSLIDRVREDSSGVLDFYLQSEPTPLVPSIEALVRWHLDGLAAGASQQEMERLRDRYAGPILVRGEPISNRISAAFARDWPPAWKDAAGIDSAAEIAVGPNATIADLVSGKATDGIISGRVTWFGGGMDFSIVQLDDGSGRALIACPKGTPGQRELGMDFIVEMKIRRREGSLGEELGFLEETMGRPELVAESVRFVRSLREEDQN